MKQQELERDFWVDVGSYSVGADLYEEGTWEIDPEGFMVADEDPVFFNFVWFYKGEYDCVTDIVPDIVAIILKNIYWNMKDN
jgi:hypothetical protein